MGDREEVNEAIQEDGGLFCFRWYLCWNVGAKLATLDGEFSSEHLRAIADHMERKREPPDA